MTEASIDAALAVSVRLVLERMFFIDLLDRLDSGGESPGIAAELSFDGDPPGSFRLAMDVAAARSAGADFLGENPRALTAGQLEDVVCELANMICGSVLSQIESSATFRLSKPAISSHRYCRQDSPAATFQASLGEGILRAEIHMERSVCTGIEESAS